MKKSIVYIAGVYPVLSETFVFREILALRAKGWQVHVIALNPSAEIRHPSLAELAQGVECVYNNRGWINLLGALAEGLQHPIRTITTITIAFGDALFPQEKMSLWARLKTAGQAIAALGVAGAVRAKGVGHVHCHFAHAPTSVGMYLARQLGLTFSFTGHANDLFQRRSMLHKKLSRAKFVNCISRWHQAFYQSICPDDSGRYRVVRCGVDCANWEPRDTRAADGALELLCVCRLVAKKGVDTLIRALGVLRRQGDICVKQLTILGDGPERARLEALASDEGVSGLIVWQGNVGNQEVRDALQTATGFVLPCREDAAGDKDGIPVVLMEAMACGVPVVVGDLPAIRELVMHEETGLLANGNDPQDVARMISRLAGDSALRHRVIEGGLRIVREEFSQDVNIDRLEASLSEVMSTPSTSKELQECA